MLLKKIGRIVATLVAVGLLALLMLIWLFFRPIDPRSPGGIKHLHELARTGQPLIADIEHYHKQHGYYPAQISDLYPDYYQNKKRRTAWYYEGWTIRENAQQYSLSILTGPGHDPLLLFRRNANGTSQWVYDPGDGSPETPLPFPVEAE